PAATRRARRSDRPVWALPAPGPDPHTIVLVDALAAAQVLSEIGYLLRQDPDERFRAKAFSAGAWSLALQRPDLVSLQRAENLTSIAGVGEGIARVPSDLIKAGESRYLNPLAEPLLNAA